MPVVTVKIVRVLVLTDCSVIMERGVSWINLAWFWKKPNFGHLNLSIYLSIYTIIYTIIHIYTPFSELMERLEEPWELTDPTPATCILLPSGTDHRDRTPPSTCYMQRQGRRWVPFASGWDSPPWTMDCYPVASGWKPLQIHIFLAANTRQAPMEVHPPPLI